MIELTNSEYRERYGRAIEKLRACIKESQLNGDNRSAKRLERDLRELIDSLKD